MEEAQRNITCQLVRKNETAGMMFLANDHKPLLAAPIFGQLFHLGAAKKVCGAVRFSLLACLQRRQKPDGQTSATWRRSMARCLGPGHDLPPLALVFEEAFICWA